ncbi:MAG: 50S ribosome-binding GTPase [Phycisphaerales bacterium]|nr:50S ribosome-binding GTPase [Phycisphaerales bacterium]
MERRVRRLSARHRLASALGGGVACIEVSGEPADVDELLRRLCGVIVRPGGVGVRHLGEVDRGCVLRTGARAAVLTPHGGPAVVLAVMRLLSSIGSEQAGDGPLGEGSAAASLVEACVLETAGRAASPLAVDVLMAQPERWRRFDTVPGDDPGCAALSGLLDRLIDPPLAVIVGPANVGKSSLLNALCRRTAAIVSPEAGTTRDHVGVTIEIEGLAVRVIDTPGLERRGDAVPMPDPVERSAIAASAGVIAEADLVISCGDLQHGFIDPAAIGVDPSRVLTCATRADLGVPASAQVITAAAAPAGPQGVEELAAQVRRRLLPDAALADPRPWVFHPALRGLPSAAAVGSGVE